MANEKYFTAKIILAINRKCAISENVEGGGGGGGGGGGRAPSPSLGSATGSDHVVDHGYDSKPLL